MNRETVITAILGLLLVLAIGVLVVMVLPGGDQPGSSGILPSIPTEHYGDFPEAIATYQAYAPVTIHSVKKSPYPNRLQERYGGIVEGYCIFTTVDDVRKIFLLAYTTLRTEDYEWNAFEITFEQFVRFGCE